MAREMCKMPKAGHLKNEENAEGQVYWSLANGNNSAVKMRSHEAELPHLHLLQVSYINKSINIACLAKEKKTEEPWKKSSEAGRRMYKSMGQKEMH